MDGRASIGWMKMGLRAQICSQCQPRLNAVDPLELLAAASCENSCPLFIQLPRLARFLERHRANPPGGYEEFVIKLLHESSAGAFIDNPGAKTGPFLDFAPEALAILEQIVALSDLPEITTPQHDCARRSLALGQMCVKAPRSANVR